MGRSRNHERKVWRVLELWGGELGGLKRIGRLKSNVGENCFYIGMREKKITFITLTMFMLVSFHLFEHFTCNNLLGGTALVTLA